MPFWSSFTFVPIAFTASLTHDRIFGNFFNISLWTHDIMLFH